MSLKDNWSTSEHRRKIAEASWNVIEGWPKQIGTSSGWSKQIGMSPKDGGSRVTKRLSNDNQRMAKQVRTLSEGNWRMVGASQEHHRKATKKTSEDGWGKSKRHWRKTEKLLGGNQNIIGGHQRIVGRRSEHC
ncbi:unnamed protein product [Ilex paraguariensis]|uniref:Uncharacterized protein n=1 Tax=Ilex paraguariensis TaxID=185542 RepID=A0ABC8RWZ4_9AQUA